MEILEKTKKSIAPRFLNMEIGEIEIYPAIRKTSLEATRSRLQNQYPTIKFSILKLDSFNYKVTRTA